MLTFQSTLHQNPISIFISQPRQYTLIHFYTLFTPFPKPKSTSPSISSNLFSIYSEFIKLKVNDENDESFSKAKLILWKRWFGVNFFEFLQNLLKDKKIFSGERRKMQFWFKYFEKLISIDAENKLWGQSSTSNQIHAFHFKTSKVNSNNKQHFFLYFSKGSTTQFI